MIIENSETFRKQNMEALGFGPAVMQKIKKCPGCGQMASSENDFCIECGSSLPNESLFDFYSSLHKICPMCRTVVSRSTLFCSHCGTDLQKIKRAETIN